MALNLGMLRQRITLENPTPTPDGDGGFTENWAALSPGIAYAAIRATAGRSGERVAGNTIVAQATHEITMRYHPDVTTETRVSWTERGSGRTRTVKVTDVTNVDEQSVELRLTCVEVTGS